MKLRIASPVICDSIVDGPGLRMVIWTQGCKHNCKGCHNPQTHSLTKGYEVDTKEVIYKMASLKLQQGITLSGGEPFLQPAPLAEIAKQAKNMDLDVWSYTGFKFEELIDRRNPLYFENLELLKYVDVLVDGKFELDKRDISLLFRGSANQRIIDVKKSLKYRTAVLKFEYMQQQELYTATVSYTHLTLPTKA